MQPTELRCAVTGTTGYVGSRVSDYFATRGCTIFEFARKPRPEAAIRRVHVPYQLDAPLDAAVFQRNRIRVLIHCAYDFRPVHWKEIHRVNVDGSTRLLRAAKEGGLDKIIFLSSISAFDRCSSLYGKAKLEIEKVATAVGAFIIRSGLVYGCQSSGGMFGTLQRSANNSAIIPLIGSGRYPQYLIHEEDLCELLFRISGSEIQFPSVPVIVASPHGWTLRDLLQVLASRPSGARFLPLPWPAMWLVLKTSELVGLRLRIRSDSVISLVRQNPNPDFSPLAQINCRIREFGGDCLREADGSLRTTLPNA